MAWLKEEKTQVNGVQEPVVKTQPGEALRPPGSSNSREKQLYEVKRRLHRSLVERLDTNQLEAIESNQVAAEIRRALTQLLAEDPFPLNAEERARLSQDLMAW